MANCVRALLSLAGRLFGCTCLLAAHQAVAMQCPGPNINSPDASQPTDTNWTAVAHEAKQRQKFLSCSAGQFSALATAAAKPGPTASNDKFILSLKQHLSSPGGAAKKLEVVARAVHVNELLRDIKIGHLVRGGFGNAWQQRWCETSYNPKKPVSAPDPPDLDEELLLLRATSVRIAQELAADVQPHPQLTCDAAVKAWIAKAKK